MSSPDEQESSEESSSELQSPPKKKCKCKPTTPLHEAIKDGDEHFVKKTFRYKCEFDINALDNTGLTPLHLAILKKEEKIAKILIENGANTNFPSHELDMLPEIDALVEETRRDFDDCTKPEYKNLRPLHYAALNGCYETVRELIKKEGLVNDFYYPTPLHCAVHSDSPEITKLLLANGAEVGPFAFYGEDFTMEERVLSMAATRGKVKILKMLLDKGTEIKDGKIVTFACVNGFQESLCLLMKNVEDINKIDGNPMQSAIYHKQSAIVKLLLEFGVDPDLEDEEDLDYRTPLQVAIENDDFEMMRILFRGGADFNHVDYANSTPLHNSVQYDFGIDVTEVLISCGANLDVINKSDKTPLNYAMHLEDSRLIKLLVENGANYDLKNKNGDNAIEQALRKNKFNGVKMFLYHKHAQEYHEEEEDEGSDQDEEQVLDDESLSGCSSFMSLL